MDQLVFPAHPRKSHYGSNEPFHNLLLQVWSHQLQHAKVGGIEPVLKATTRQGVILWANESGKAFEAIALKLELGGAGPFGSQRKGLCPAGVGVSAGGLENTQEASMDSTRYEGELEARQDSVSSAPWRPQVGSFSRYGVETVSQNGAVCARENSSL